MILKIEIKNRWTGSVIFSLETENNTVAKTVRAGLKAGADLSGANLRNADLRNAYLRNADLSGANLSNANLSNADLRNADLSGADLSGADLSGADLSGADLSGADLSNADLRNADLSGAINAEYAIAATRVCPEGDIIGYKKALNKTKNGNVIVKLLIPAAAKRNNAFGRKCRAEYAQVLSITGPKGSEHKTAISTHDKTFIYRVGETVKPTKPFNEDFTDECSAGIHFFITQLEAKKY